MKLSNRSFSRSLLALSAATACISYAHAYNVPPRQSGSTTYVTGGFGDEERDAIKAVKNDYNLYILSATKSGAYVGDTHVVIRNRQGQEVLNADAGPLFYANLPAGSYVVEANSEGQVIRKNITVSNTRPAQVNFSWNTSNQ